MVIMDSSFRRTSLMPLSFNMKSAVNFPLRSKRTGKASINTLEPKKTANQVLHELILFMYGIS